MDGVMCGTGECCPQHRQWLSVGLDPSGLIDKTQTHRGGVAAVLRFPAGGPFGVDEYSSKFALRRNLV
jgi:hypothetical protein